MNKINPFAVLLEKKKEDDAKFILNQADFVFEFEGWTFFMGDTIYCKDSDEFFYHYVPRSKIREGLQKLIDMGAPVPEKLKTMYFG